MTALSSFLHLNAHASGAAAQLAPISGIAFVLQVAAVGAAIGSAVALRARGRNADADVWRITTAWATLGLVVGVAIGSVAAM